MEVIKELVCNVVIIILLTTFLDMLLPSGGLRPFVKVIMGLFVLVSMLNPVLNFFLGEREFEVFAWQQDKSMPGFTTVLADSNRLNDVNKEIFLENYATSMALQMEAMLKLLKGVRDIDVNVVLTGGRQAGSIEGVKAVTVTVERIKTAAAAENSVAAAAKKNEEIIIAKEIKDTLAQYFAIKSAQISVFFVG